MKKNLLLTILLFISFFYTENLMAQITSVPTTRVVTSAVYRADVSAILYDYLITPNLTEIVTITVPVGYEIAVDASVVYSAVDFTVAATAATNFTLHVRRIANTAAQSASTKTIHISSPGTPIGIDVTLTGGAITAVPLTITGITVTPKAYDGNSSATLGGSASLVGVLGGDAVTIVAGTATFNSVGVANGIALTATGYSLSGAAAGNYTVSQPSGLTGNITAKGLTISGITVTPKVYDGNNTATLGGTASLVGVVGSETVTIVAGSATFNSINVANGIPLTATGYSLGGVDAGNYTVSQPSLTGNITAKGLTITGITVTPKVYDGNNTTTLGGSPSLVGVVGADAVTIVAGSATYNTVNVANGIPVTASGYTLGGAAGNYTLTSQPTGLTGNITAKGLTITGITVTPKVYDATNTATLGGSASLVGVVGLDVVTIVAGTATYNTVNVGTSIPLTATGYSLGGAQAGNYTVSQPTLTGDINKKALTIGAATIAPKAYDKSAVSGAVTPGAITAGLVGTQTVTVSATGLYADALVANGKTATISYTLGNGANGGLLGNYSLANGTGTGNITKKALTVTGLTADNKVYDRLTTATYTGTAAFLGVETGDFATPNITGIGANFATKTVGVGKTVTFSGITIDGADAANYSVTQPTALANITPKPLTITSVTAHNKVYDGTTPTTVSGGVLGGVIALDVVSIAPGCTADFDTKNVGTNKVVTVSVLTLAGADGGNYSLPLPLTLHADITKAPLIFTGGSIAPRDYDGTTTPGVITPGLPTSGYVGTETLNVGTVSTANYFATYPGAYPCTLVYALTDNLGTGGLVSNYQQFGDFVNGVVNPKTLHLTTPTTISPKVFDGTTNSGVVHPGTINPLDLVGLETVTISGFGVFPNKNTDAVNGGDQIATITYVLGPGTHGGLPNYYTIANGTAHGSTTAKPIHVKATINNKHYDGNTSAVIATATLPDVDVDDVPNVTLGGVGVATFTSATVGHDKPVGVLGYSISGLKAANYSLLQPTGCTANITPAEGEVGDRVWQDWDANGIQDPGELGYPGITVELHNGHAIAPGSTPLSTAVTDANGKYSFSAGAGPSTANYKYGIVGFNPSQPYTIRIPNVAGVNKQGWLGANVLTAAHQGGDVTKDSDGDFPLGVTDYAQYEFTSPAINNDNYDIDFGFTPGGISCGCGGGLESKSLGDAIGNRIFNKAIKSVSNTVDYNKMPAIQTRTIQNGVTGIGTALTLEELLPKQIAGASNYKALNTTPKDITSITNAKDVLSIDYTLNNTAKAVAFATKTQGEVYDHTKAVCDRLKGAELLGMQNVTIEGVKMVRFDLINPEGQTEYAMSFAVGAKTGRANYTIQSNWLNNDYTPDEVMYNVQLWGASSEVVSAMAKDIVTRLNASLPVKEVLSNSTLPSTYITKGKRVADKIILNINNATTSTNGYFEVIEKANEQSSLLVKKQVPFTVSANGKTTVEVPEGDNYESTINMYINNTLQDQVFMSDGNWAAAVNSSNSSVKSVTVTNDPKRVADNADDFLLFRNVQVEATTPDYVSVYKVLRGGGAPQDLTGYRTFQFTASGKGASTSLIVTLIKNGITNWADQYSVILPLSTSPREYKVNLDDFVSTVSKNKISPSDVTMVIFGIGVNSGNMTTVSADISNVSFTKTDFAYLNSLKSTEISVYPNPATNHFTANFKSATQNVLTMNLTEASTGKVVFSKTVNAQVGNNSVPVSIDRNTGLNTYILSLEGTGIKYTPKKVLMEK